MGSEIDADTIIEDAAPPPDSSAFLKELAAASPAEWSKRQIEDALQHQPQIGLRAALGAIARSLQSALDSEPHNTWFIPLFECFAIKSRDSAWRKWLGPGPRLSGQGWEAPCILSIALNALKVYGGSNGFAAPDLDEIVRLALRLIANGCADESENRRFVVHQDGLETILRLEKFERLSNFTVPALYNICIDFEDPAVQDHASANGQHITEADRRLADASNRHGLISTVALLHLSRPSGALSDDLLSLLVDLIEMSTRSTERSRSRRDGQNSPELAAQEANDLVDILSPLIVGLGPSLASYNSDFRTSICRSVINLLSQDRGQQAFLSFDGLLHFLALPHRSQESDDDSDTVEDLKVCTAHFLRLTYEMSAMPEFLNRYTFESESIAICMENLREMNVRGWNGQYIPLTWLCVVLTNITTSMAKAEALVQVHQIHPSLASLIGDGGPDVLPAVNLMSKLALSEKNKSILVQSDALESLCRLLQSSPVPAVQREAVIAARLLTKGQLDHLERMSGATQSSSRSPNSNSTFLEEIFRLYRETTDGSIKLEIGRFVIEVCRTLFPLENANSLFECGIGERTESVEAIAFVIQHGEGPSRSEGWFGLAMLSTWPSGQPMVLRALEDLNLREEMNRVALSKQGPSFENLRLLLVKLSDAPSDSIITHQRTQLDAVCREAGLKIDSTTAS